MPKGNLQHMSGTGLIEETEKRIYILFKLQTCTDINNRGEFGQF